MEKLGNIEIYNADCLEVLQTLPEKSVDVVLCDPPYGIDYQSAWRTDKNTWKPKIANDKKPFIEPIKMLPRLLKETGCAYIFTRWDVQQVFIDELNRCGMKVRSVIVWDKEAHSMGDLNKAYGSRYESIIFAANNGFKFPNGRPTDIIRYPRVPAEKLSHPNEKPVPLLQKIINQAVKRRGGVILDFCMGSGSTMLAAHEEGCRGIGIEIDASYYDLAKRRLKNLQSQLKLF